MRRTRTKPLGLFCRANGDAVARCAHRAAESRPQLPCAARLAATLTEVLMAMLIAGIGLVTVATLFPIAILRSVQGTQLTNATVLRYNAETMLDIYPDLVHNPDGTDADSNGSPYDEHFGRRYIVDPVGWWILGTDYQTSMRTLKTWFGNDGATPTPNPIAPAANRLPRWLRRYNGGLTSTTNARQLVTLPDSWIHQFEGIPTATTGVSVTLPTAFDATNFPTAQSRVVVFDTRNGRSGQVRESLTLTLGPPATFSWSEPLPSDLNEDRNGNGSLDAGEDVNGNGSLDNNVERVRVETREHRYTWLLTVRKNSFGDANIDVVVVFRREYSATDERAYDATFLANDARVWVKYSSNNGTVTLPGISDPDSPLIKKGSFVLDTTNARWYRIIDVEEISASSGINYDLRLTLERRAFESAGEDRIQGTATDPDGTIAASEDTNGNNVGEYGGAIFMRGVVEVFTLGTRMFPRELLEGP